MRRTKQPDVSQRMVRAQMMAQDRSNHVTNDINQRTGRSLERAVQADRNLQKQVGIGANFNAEGDNKYWSIDMKIYGKDEEQPVQPPVPPTNNTRRVQVSAYAGRDRESLAPNQIAALKAQAGNQHPDRYMAHGINGNAAEEARRRKKLESRIREAANK